MLSGYTAKKCRLRRTTWSMSKHARYERLNSASVCTESSYLLPRIFQHVFEILRISAARILRDSHLAGRFWNSWESHLDRAPLRGNVEVCGMTTAGHRTSLHRICAETFLAMSLLGTRFQRDLPLASKCQSTRIPNIISRTMYNCGEWSFQTLETNANLTVSQK